MKMHAMLLEKAGPPFEKALLDGALEEIRANYHPESPGEEWCLPRLVMSEGVVVGTPSRGGEEGGKGAVEDGGEGREVKSTGVVVVVVEPAMGISLYHHGGRTAQRRRSRVLDKTTINSFKDMQAIAYGLIHNPHSITLSLSTMSPRQSYQIPPGSAFYLANIDMGSAAHFSSAAQSFYSAPTATAGPGQFDLILLDPPWENRSAKRSRQYRTMRQQCHPVTALVEMLGRHMSPKGVVACWITNNSSARADVMEAFEKWGVDLFEEWAWLKTTPTGIPVVDIDGVWRKPYEILLLGRRSDTSMGNDTTSNAPHLPVVQRVIVAVPDMHSRKPCLKRLFEPFMPDPQHYRALEIFARNLAAGWCSWGNEVIKYNWEGYWAKAVDG